LMFPEILATKRLRLMKRERDPGACRLEHYDTIPHSKGSAFNLINT
jgi:hypothetical protein